MPLPGQPTPLPDLTAFLDAALLYDLFVGASCLVNGC